MSIEFKEFPDVQGYHNVVKAVEKYPHLAPGKPVTYRAKVKLHGTNAGIRVVGGTLAPQSRSQVISTTNDNCGFARWAVDHAGCLKGSCMMSENYTVFGEWCGPGIMKGTAINKIPNKVLAIFAVRANDTMIVDPQVLEERLGEMPPDVFILPWHGKPLTVDFSSRDSLLKAAETANAMVAEVEPCDPWVKATFGVEGTGEGLVFYPDGDPFLTVERFSSLAFKAKGEKHKVVKTKDAVQVDPEVAAGAEAFAKLFVTDARLEQGLTAIGGVADPKQTGAFLKWFMADVMKESKAELEASGLKWDQVQREVQAAARRWWLTKATAI